MKLKKFMQKNLFEQSTLKMSVLFFLYLFCATPSISQPYFQFILGNNKPISQIGFVYGEKLGINSNNGNNGNNNNGSSDPYIVNHDLQFGIQAFKSLKVNRINLNYGVTVAVGSSSIFFKDGIGKVIAFKIDEFLQTGIFSKTPSIEDLRNDQDKTLAKERKNGLKNLPDKDGFVASNALDSHLTGNPNYDPDTVSQNYQKNLI